MNEENNFGDWLFIYVVFSGLFISIIMDKYERPDDILFVGLYFLICFLIKRLYVIFLCDNNGEKLFTEQKKRKTYSNPVYYRGSKWLKWEEEKNDPMPRELHFYPKTSDKDKERITRETRFRYYWAKRFDNNYFNKELLKYNHPNEVINTALNLEYALGYKGYYDKRLIIDGDYSILEEIQKCKNNPRYFTPSYYYCYYNDKNNILSLLGEEISLRDLTNKLISLQFTPKIEPHFQKDSYEHTILDNYNFYLITGQYVELHKCIVDDDSRLAYRDLGYCTITLDARNALVSGTVTESIVSSNTQDRYRRNEHKVYLEDNRIKLIVDLPGVKNICNEEFKIPMNSKVKIFGISLENGYVLRKQDLYSKDEIDKYKRKLRSEARKLEKKVEEGGKLED